MQGRALLETVEAPTVDGPSDQQLVARVRRGDDRAFETLYRRYQRRISAYVYGMVKDHGRAEDVTQEVFVSALRRMRQTERPIAFKPWIYEIAKNACIDAFRRSRRAEEVSYDADEGLAPNDYGKLVGSGPTPVEAVAAKEDIARLRGAFGGLSDMHHEILVLRELEGFSYREIGDRLGLSRPAVESTLFRARKRLTEEYDELVSGARCLRIQAIIATAGAGAGAVGVRDSRRLARHVAHCQPCRRLAAGAGLDVAALAPPTRRAAHRGQGRGLAAVPDPVPPAPGRRRRRRDRAARGRRWGAGGSGLGQDGGCRGDTADRGRRRRRGGARREQAARRGGRFGDGRGRGAARAPRRADGHRSGRGDGEARARDAGDDGPRPARGGERGFATAARRRAAAVARTRRPVAVAAATPGGSSGGGDSGNAPTKSSDGGGGGGVPKTPSPPKLPNLPLGGGGGSLPVQVPQDPAQTVTDTANQVTDTANQVTDTVDQTVQDVTEPVHDAVDQVAPGAGGLLP